MNQKQRDFLIKKIQSNTRDNITRFRLQLQDEPDVRDYLKGAIVANQIELQSLESIKKWILGAAIDGDDLFDQSGDWRSEIREIVVQIPVAVMFVFPEKFNEIHDKWRAERDVIEKQIEDIEARSETLCARILLSSDKVLQTLVDEVDNLGNLSLMETKLQLLGSGSDQKKLNK